MSVLAGGALAVASPVSDVGATLGSLTGGGLSFTFTGGQISTTSPGTLAAATLSDLTVDLTGMTANPGPVSVGNITITSGVDSLVLNVLNASLNQVIAAPLGVGFITGTVSTASNTIADLAAFSAGGAFALSYNGAVVTSNGVHGNMTLMPGATASLTLSAVPEPSTLLLAALGAGFLTLASARRRRRA